MNRRDMWILLIILILLLVLYICPVFYDYKGEEEITIFVIDTFYEGILSHGDIVTSIIESKAPQFNINRLNVKEKNVYGLVKYYEALDYIYNYKLRNYEEKIIVNISLGFYEADEKHKVLIKNLTDLGVGIVAAAGNDDSPISFYPAAYQDEVIAVASIVGKKKTDYSNYGEYIDICAEGNFFTTIGLSQIFSYRASGTSFAAPRVSSFLAKIIAAEQEINFTEAKEKLQSLSVDLDDPLYEKGLLGEGKISNWNFMVKYDKTKLFYNYILPVIIFLLIFYLLIKRMGLIAVPYLFLILIIIGPLLVLFRDYITAVFSQKLYTLFSLKLIIIFIVSFYITKVITSFEKYYLFILYLIFYIIGVIVLSLVGFANIYVYIILNVKLVILFYLSENYIYYRKKNSKSIGDLDSGSLKVVRAVKGNIIKKLKLNEKTLYELLKLFKETSKKEVKKAIYEILVVNLDKIPIYYLMKNARHSSVIKFILNRIKEDNQKITVRQLFKLIDYNEEYMEDIFQNYEFEEIFETLKKEFHQKNIELDTLIKIVNYYDDGSSVEFLLTIYDKYSNCWKRYLIASSILKLSSREKRQDYIKRFRKDKCGLVQQEAEYYI